MLRTARKNELNSDSNEILRMWREDYSHPETVIEWVPGKRQEYGHKMLYKGFWALMMNNGIDDLTGEADNSPLERVGEIMICTECQSLFESIPGSCLDDIECCEECDAPLYD